MKDLDKHISFLMKKTNDDFSRLGKLFKTDEQQYLYDLGCTMYERRVFLNLEQKTEETSSTTTEGGIAS